MDTTMNEKLDAFNGTLTALGVFLGILSTLIVGWWRGQNGLNEVVDRRIKMILEEQGRTIISKDTEIGELQASYQELKQSYKDVLEKLQALVDEHAKCPSRVEFNRIQEEVNALRGRVDDHSEPYDV